MTGRHVIVWGIESGPGRPIGRPVEVDGEDIGVAVDRLTCSLSLKSTTSTKSMRSSGETVDPPTGPELPPTRRG